MPILATLRANVAATLLGLLAGILLIIAIVQTIQIYGFGIWPLKIPGLKAKYETSLKKLNAARGELERISTAKNEQQAETGGNIKEAGTIRDKAEGEARKIEQAPLPGNCKTPPEILGADL